MFVIKNGNIMPVDMGRLNNHAICREVHACTYIVHACTYIVHVCHNVHACYIVFVIVVMS